MEKKRQEEVSTPATLERPGFEDTSLASGSDIASRPVSSPKNLQGQVLNDLYRIKERIGIGGMGTVYRATHVNLQRDFAVKVLSRPLSSDDDGVERFKREAMAASRIDHDNIVDVVNLNSSDDGELFIVMELLLGESLAERLDRGPIPIEDSLSITYQICRALSAAHQHKIVHRDLKPGNIFLTEKAGIDFVKVLDFGISKMKMAEAAKVRMTKTGQLVGTPLYMSPEQAKGDPEITASADIYALGCILYEMITGVPPFDGKNHFQLLWMHGNETPIRPRKRAPEVGIPATLDQVIMKALEKKPEERHLDMASFELALMEAMPHVPTPPVLISTMPSSGRISAPTPTKKHPYSLYLILLIAGITLAMLILPRLIDPPPPASLEASTSTEPSEPSTPTTVSSPLTAPSPAATALTPDAAPATTTQRRAVNVEFASTPAQAEVYLGERRLGVTPFRSAVHGDVDQIEVEFRRRGYRSTRISFVPLEGASVEARLFRARSEPGRRSGETQLKQEM